MTLRMFYFSWLRERIGAAEESLEVPAQVATVQALVDWLRGRDGGHAGALADLRLVRVAVNQEYVPFTHPLKAGDEVAFFPPVTGG